MNYVDLASFPAWNEGLLVLMYHLIETPPLHHPLRGLYVEPAKLRSQLQELKAAGVAFTALGESPVADQRQVALTFDDGFQNVGLNALPILREFDITAVTYVAFENIGRTNLWDRDLGAQMRPLMNREELQVWIKGGQELGSHGLTHRSLTNMPLAEARREIFESKALLEELAARPVRHFCYPYGITNQVLRDLVQEAGYETATTTMPGLNLPEQDPLLLRRCLARHQSPFGIALAHRWRQVFDSAR